MKRVLVIGSCGSGKSTLSRRLHERTGLPLVHLDRHYWKPGWVEPAKDEWRSKVSELISEDSWILDGNYGGTMEMRLKRADTVIWLDLSRYLCVLRVLKRTFVPGYRSRIDLAEGCSERFEFDFLKYVWNFPRDKNPLLEKRIAELGGSVDLYRLKSRSEIESFFNSFEIIESPSPGTFIDAN